MDGHLVCGGLLLLLLLLSLLPSFLLSLSLSVLLEMEAGKVMATRVPPFCKDDMDHSVNKMNDKFRHSRCSENTNIVDAVLVVLAFLTFLSCSPTKYCGMQVTRRFTPFTVGLVWGRITVSPPPFFDKAAAFFAEVDDFVKHFVSARSVRSILISKLQYF